MCERVRRHKGFARVINHATEAGEVRIDAVDGEGESYGPVMLSIDAGEAVHFNSDDLESGNADNRRRWGRCGSRARRVWARC